MVRCMSSIYYLLRTEAPEKPEKARSPFLSRSSTNVILPRRVNGEENSTSNSKYTVEIASISVDKNQMPDVSYAITHYRLVQKKNTANYALKFLLKIASYRFLLSWILDCLWNSLKELI